MIPVIPLESSIPVDNNTNVFAEMPQGPKLYIATNLNGDDTIFEVIQMPNDSNDALQRTLELKYGGYVRTRIVYGRQIYKLEDIHIQMINESSFFHVLLTNVRLLIYCHSNDHTFTDAERSLRRFLEIYGQ